MGYTQHHNNLPDSWFCRLKAVFLYHPCPAISYTGQNSCNNRALYLFFFHAWSQHPINKSRSFPSNLSCDLSVWFMLLFSAHSWILFPQTICLLHQNQLCSKCQLDCRVSLIAPMKYERLLKAVFLHCYPDCSSCRAHLALAGQLGQSGQQ